MRSCFVLLWASIALGAATAAAGQAPETLSLRDAIREARHSNPELIALQRQADAARTAIASSRAFDPPMVEAQIWGWPVTTLNPSRTDMYMFTGEQTLPGRGKRDARQRVAAEDARVSDAQVAVRANAIYRDIKQAYVELFLARTTADLLDQQVPLLEATTEAATIRYTAGQAGQHDTVKSLVELSRIGVDAVEWRERAHLAEAQLNVLMGRTPDAPVGPLTSANAAVPALDDAVALAMSRNPDISAAAILIAREDAELARLQRERHPDYVVGGGYMLQPGGAGAWTARGGLTWPNAPWSRGRFDADIAAQEQRVAMARAQRDALELDVRRGIREAAVRLEAAQERVRLLNATVLPHLTHAVDVAAIAYRSTRGEYSDLLDSQRLLLSTRMDLIAAQANVQRAAADLELAIGVAPED